MAKSDKENGLSFKGSLSVSLRYGVGGAFRSPPCSGCAYATPFGFTPHTLS